MSTAWNAKNQLGPSITTAMRQLGFRVLPTRKPSRIAIILKQIGLILKGNHSITFLPQKKKCVLRLPEPLT
jgi:hypothetical protein